MFISLWLAVFQASSLSGATLPPSLLQSPAHQTALASDTVTFSVTASGSPPLAYQWFKSGQPLAGATNTSLVLAAVGLPAAGPYAVRVTNSAGSVTSAEAMLTVLAQSVRINEWMANNTGVFRDEDGDGSDWLELYNPNPESVSLGGWYLTDTLVRATNWMIPSNVVIAPHGFLMFWASSKDRTFHTNFRLSNSGEALGLATPNGVLRDQVTFGEQTTDESQGLYPDGTGLSDTLTTPTPGGPNRRTYVSSRVLRPLSASGTTWKYKTGTDLGTSWRALAYDDSSWPSGPAQLGFGDGDESTVIDGGPNPDERYPTTYFRRSFMVSNAPLYSNLVVRLLRDDGAVVYLNGMEIRRDNLPLTNVSYGTYALASVGGTEENNFTTTPVAPNVLREGQNVLAVEVHQATPISSDLSFELALLAEGPVSADVVRLTNLLMVPAGYGVTLEPSTTAGLVSFQWTRNGYVVANATNATLSLADLQNGGGGSYRLLGTDSSGQTFLSGYYEVTIPLPAVPLEGDVFATRSSLNGTNGYVQGTNAMATREPGEPFHARTDGSRSMWFAWQAPATGIATFDTDGSAFETLLAVYTGTQLTNLTELASDRGTLGYGGSQVRLNVEAGQNYQIAVDGANSAAGRFRLHWFLEMTPQRVPAFRTLPESHSISERGFIFLTAETDDVDVKFQWYFEGQPIPGAVDRSLYITNVAPAQLGRYALRIVNIWQRERWTAPARVSYGDCAFIYDAQDTYRGTCPSARPYPLPPNPFVMAFASAATNAPTGAIPGTLRLGGVQTGTVRTTTTNTVLVCNRTQLMSPQYYYLTVTDSGILELNTCGSDFPVLLALYRLAPTSDSFLLATDFTNAPLREARIRLKVAPLADYVIVVAGYNNAHGLLRLNQHLSPDYHLLGEDAGRMVTLSVNTSDWTRGPYQFRWLLNDALLTASSEPTLRVPASAGRTGKYTLEAFNAEHLGVTNVVADLLVTNGASPVLRRFELSRGGADVPYFSLDARGTRPIILETSDTVDFRAGTVWRPLLTNYVLDFSTCMPMASPGQMFRLR